MKFFTAAATFFLTTAVASPVAVPEPFLLDTRDATVVGTINTSVNALVPTLPAAEAAIQNAVNAILTSTSVETALLVQLEAAVNANLAQITTALQAATAQITAAAAAAAGGVVGAAQSLTQAEIAELQQDIATLQNIIQGLNATVTATAALTGAARIAVAGELAALQNAIAPFLAPILVFAEAALQVSTGVTVNGLQNAVNGLLSIVNGTAASVGLSGLSSLINNLLAILGLKGI